MKRPEPTRISDPRPPSAWLLAWVASATLWITGELSVWIIPVQATCYVVSYVTRHDPPAWRRSAVWLNVGMLLITSVTIQVALRGSPATLSLAYFSALTQGLHLMDARPRKSEFLLVALALFQVILAANLTDSVFYPPLLVLFLIAATWTLLVHTLRVEAARAGDVRAATTAVTPGLRRTTIVAVSVSVGIALVLFMLLPRMRASVLTGRLGADLAVSGFSDHIALGDIGQIRRDDRVVLRVETLEGKAAEPGDAYWRGLAFDAFDGRNWSISNHPLRRARSYVSGSPRFGVELSGGPGAGAVVQRIVREPVEAGVLFGAGTILRIEGPLEHLSMDENGGLYYPGKPDARIRYTAWTPPPVDPGAALSADHTAPPVERGPRGDDRAHRWTALPPLPAAVHQLAERITAGLPDDAAKLRAIEAHLRRQGRYTDDPPPMGVDDGHSPISDFLLGELAGHCEYFASGMVVLSRSLGMPARLVNGFAGGRRNRLGGFTEVTRADAHAWVEVHFAEAGWVRFDPTPPDLRMRADTGLGWLSQVGEIASVIELWWFQRVVDFDSSDQILALKSIWIAAQSLLARFDEDPEPARWDTAKRAGASRPRGPRSPWALPDAGLLALFAAPLGIGLALRWHRAQRGPRRMFGAYRRALRALSRAGLVREPATTARAFAARVGDLCPAEVSRPFARITEAYLQDRFGAASDAAPRSALSDELNQLRAALRSTRTRAARSRRAAPADARASQSAP